VSYRCRQCLAKTSKGQRKFDRASAGVHGKFLRTLTINERGRVIDVKSVGGEIDPIFPCLRCGGWSCTRTIKLAEVYPGWPTTRVAELAVSRFEGSIHPTLSTKLTNAEFVDAATINTTNLTFNHMRPVEAARDLRNAEVHQEPPPADTRSVNQSDADKRLAEARTRVFERINQRAGGPTNGAA